MEKQFKCLLEDGPLGRGRGVGAVEKAKNFKGTLGKLIKNHLSQYKFRLFIVFLFALASTIFSIVGPKILGNATTEISKGIMSKIAGSSGIDFGVVGNILLTVLALYVISALFSFIQGMIMTGVAQKLTYDLRDDLSRKIHKLPMNYFDKNTNGEVLSVITNDIDTLSQNLNQSVTQIITAICTVVRNINNDDYNKYSNDYYFTINTSAFCFNFKNYCKQITKIFQKATRFFRTC